MGMLREDDASDRGRALPRGGRDAYDGGARGARLLRRPTPEACMRPVRRRSPTPVPPEGRQAATPARPLPATGKLKVWVAFADGVKFGRGRAELLELVERLGSIRQAVERLDMSYRNAWGYLRELERAAGFPLLERRPGGPAAGMRLTPAGREFLERYRRFEAESATAATQAFRRAFPPARGPRRA